jgi:hypothetical protein
MLKSPDGHHPAASLSEFRPARCDDAPALCENFNDAVEDGLVTFDGALRSIPEQAASDCRGAGFAASVIRSRTADLGFGVRHQ